MIVAASALLLLSSCRTTKTNVGTFREAHGEKYTYSKGKQVWILWGIFPLGRTSVNTPQSGNCQVVTRTNLADFIVSGITAGIITTETIKVIAKRGTEADKGIAPAAAAQQPTTIQINNNMAPTN